MNCRIDAHCIQFVVGYSSASGGYFTNYYTCNDSTSITGYIKFYNSDSIRMIYDDLAQPPPNKPISFRFYGLRINNKIITGINELTDNKRGSIYPNPCNRILTIEYKMINEKGQIIITDMLGSEIKNEMLQFNEKTQLDVSDLRKGSLLCEDSNNKRNFYKKIIIIN